MIHICNLRYEILNTSYDFRVDRGSPLGNPYLIDNITLTRDKVCDLYESYFHKLINEFCPSGFVVNYLEKIRMAYKKHGTVRLFCWCAPENCHAETIANWLKEVEKL